MIPLLVARLIVEAVGDDDMGDLSFLSIKESEGKVRDDVGVQPPATTGDLGTLTASGGKDMYLGRAHASIRPNGSSPTGNLEVVLKINDIIKDRWYTGIDVRTNIGGMIGNDYEFAIGFKVTTGQIIKLEVIDSATSTEVTGTIECWEENTGVSPQIPPLEPV